MNSTLLPLESVKPDMVIRQWFETAKKSLSDPEYSGAPKVEALRIKTAEETCAAILPKMPMARITRVANFAGHDRIGIPVVMVTRPNSRSLALAQGKDLTLWAA